MKHHKLNILFGLLLFIFVVTACGTKDNPTESTVEVSASTPIPTATIEPEPPIIINPLTGKYVEEPDLLQLPALLISISHFPVTARPQAGLSFAPWVFEIYITEGATRFLSVFYGAFPQPEATVGGSCQARNYPFVTTSHLIGNRVWLDENANQIQDDWEHGIGGVCINLFDANGNFLQATSTDSNGYYGFNVDAGSYILVFEKPAGMDFVQKNAGDKSKDSDVEPLSGQTEAVTISSALRDLDAGLFLTPNHAASSQLPIAKVGPIRSGRLVYADIAAFFKDSCLIYALASPEVLEEIPQCFLVTHDIDGGGYMLETDKLRGLAEENKTGEIDYESNIFDSTPPSGGIIASNLHVYISYLNQSAWVYDALSESYWRYVDNADFETAGILHPEIDRLTNRQLQFENVIVLFTKHKVVSPTNLDIQIEEDSSGDALLFRDGLLYEIKWTTNIDSDEEKDGYQKPIQFVTNDETTLFPLKPGRTWILVVTPKTPVEEVRHGEWLLNFLQPEGAK